jgi:hypothetical protein
MNIIINQTAKIVSIRTTKRTTKGFQEEKKTKLTGVKKDSATNRALALSYRKLESSLGG